MGLEKLKEAMALIKECISEYEDNKDSKDDSSDDSSDESPEEDSSESSEEPGDSGLSGKNKAVLMVLKKRAYGK